MYLVRPLTIWEDETSFKIGPVTEPQEKGKVFGSFPKSNPNSKTMALLFKQVLFKWQSECRNNKELEAAT